MLRSNHPKIEGVMSQQRMKPGSESGDFGLIRIRSTHMSGLRGYDDRFRLTADSQKNGCSQPYFALYVRDSSQKYGLPRMLILPILSSLPVVRIRRRALQT